MSIKLIHTVFENEAIRVPQNTAIVEEGSLISYATLNHSANRLAWLLLELGVRKDSVIATMLPSGIELVRALVAIFKSGGTYLPLDVAFAERRLLQIFSQCKPEVLITSAVLKEQVVQVCERLGINFKYLVVSDQQELFLLDAKNSFKQLSFDSIDKTKNPDVAIDPTDSNYIFYTSGSTGEAKGIVGKHESLSHFIHWEIKEFSINENVRVSQLAQVTFDASLRDIFVPLCSGGTLCVPSVETKTNTSKLVEWIESNRISLVHCVPSLFRILTKELKTLPVTKDLFSSLNYVLLAGEALYVKDIRAWREVLGERVELVNLYGATETTLIKTFYRIKEVSEDLAQVIPVGKPIDNTIVAIINDDHICRIGEIGEIYLKTPFWSKGYINKDEVISNPFVQNPLIKDRDDIVYKTGDLGRYLSDRNVEVIGRIDNQIKVNGVRVEINEVEKAILKLDGITQTIVIANKTPDYFVELICYYTGTNHNTDVILTQLRRELNDNLIPSYFLWLEEFPLNINGKIDKKALPKPQEILEKEFEYEKPINEVEEKLEEIWKAVLRVEKIGRKTSFFQLGGSSLKVIQVISRIYKEFNTLISIADVFSNPTIEKVAAIIEKSLKSAYEEIPVIPLQPHYAVSHAQKRLWVLNQLDPANIAYNIPGAFVFEGQLNKEALDQTFHTLIDRHEILRTSFIVVEGEPRQKIQNIEEVDFHVAYEDLRDTSDKEERSKAIGYEESTRPFDLAQGPLLRARLLQLSDDRYVFLFTMHHIISDAWSMDVLVGEVFVLYKSYTEGLSHPLKPLRIQYKDYAAWQSLQLNGEKLSEAQHYWWNQFTGEIPKLELPTDYPRPAVKTYNGNQQSISFSKESMLGLNELSSQHGGTLFITLVSVTNVLLYKYSGQEDIVIGSPIAGRNHQDLEDQIGIYLNNLSLRSTFSGSDIFSDLLASTKNNTLEAYKHQHYPFDRLVDDLKLDRDMSRSPLFDVVVVLNVNQGDDGANTTEEIKGRDIDSGLRTSLVDLRIIFNQIGDRLNMTIEYNTDLFKAERIQRMLIHYQELINNILKDPHQRLADLGYLDSAEQDQLLNGFNQTKHSYNSPASLHQLVELVASHNGDRVAVEFGSQSLTYDVLNSKSNQLAHYLRTQHQIGRDSRVGVMVDRSERLIIGLLAILKAGGCYVPIDPVYPNERKSYLFKDSEISLLLTESDKLFDLEGYTGSLFALDVELDGLTTPTTNPDYVNAESDLAYMIYTSGSTGHPKGVMIEHRGVVNMVLSQIELFGVTREDKVLQFASSSFDASISEIFMAFGCGGCVVMIGEGDQKDPLRFKDYVLSKGVSVATLPPSYVRVLPEESLSGLRVLITAGEPANVDDAISLSKNLDYFNAYGPTEYSVCVSVHKVRGDEAPYGSIPIGKPIPNTECYVLDSSLSLVGIGIDGELYVSGIGLARGYHKRETLTQESFIMHPYQAGARLYKTGDLVRWTEEGEMLYKGRRDHQVKINGYRIESGEIESVLKQYEGVQEAVVEAVVDGSGDKVLVGYVVGIGGSEDAVVLSESDLKDHLRKQLPAYMVPSYVIILNELPLTASGKIDRHSLPKPSDLAGNTQQYVAPTTQTEQVLVSIWEEVLGRKPIGVEDNFFEIGGQSLKAIQVVSRIHKEFKKQVELRSIFNYPTIHLLSGHLQSLHTHAYEVIEPVPLQPHYAVSHAQKRLWVLNQLDPANIAYNIPGAFVFEGQLNKEALDRTFRTLIDRHEILRTSFIVVEGEPRQKIQNSEAVDFHVAYEDLRDTSDKEERSKAIGYEESTRSFDLAHGPLLRARLLQLSDDRYVFLFTMHHIISDAWSMDVLVGEVFVLYKSYTEGLSHPLKPLRIQYKDYAAWQSLQLNGEKLSEAQHYWWNQFTGEIPKLELPTDYPRPAVKTYNGNQQSISFSKESMLGLNELSSQHGGTLFMTLVSVTNVLLYKYSGQEDIVIGSPIAGRNHQDLEDQIGIYLNNLSLRSTFSGGDIFSDLLASTKNNTLEAYKHQHYPFDRLVDDLKLDRDMSRSPLFDVVVVLNVNQDDDGANTTEEIKGRDIDSGLRTSLVDLRIIFNQIGDRLNMTIEYNTDLFKAERIQRMLIHYQELVNNILKDPRQRLADLGYLDSVEQDQLLNGFNQTKHSYNSPASLHQLIERVASQNGDKIAVAFGDVSLTYHELNNRSNQLAHYLRSQHQIGRDSRVGVMVDRSERLIIGLLAILKAGGCYVPIDPVYPNERKSYLFKDSEISLLLTESDKLFDLEGYSGSLFALDVELDGLTTPTTNPDYVNDENDLAYMIYTSGSTGHPKGVMIEHRGVVNMVLSQVELFGVTREDKVLQFASSSFDASISEIFMALGCGGCVVMIGEGDQKDPLRFIDYILSKGVSVATLPPSYVRVLPEESLSGLRVLITAGEPANVDDAIALSKDLDYFNAYGPTEYSVCVSVHKVRGDEMQYGSIPIGKPIPNTECYVLSESGSLTGIGIDGTLYVSGSGLARGYHNRKDLTEERFVSHRYKPGERLYNTGDIVRWTESGELLYKGRADKQLKLRGYRIETGEIESVLKQYEGVQEAVVEAIADGSGEKVLVGYIVAEDKSLTAQEVKEYLQKYLPVYMVPDYIVTLTEIPLTASGKIDRQALPKPGDMLDSTRQYVAPVTETEQSLVAIWEEVLGRKPIGIEDNFFEIGGQSLRAIQIVSRIHKELGKQVELRSIFSHPSIKMLSDNMQSLDDHSYESIQQLPIQKDYILSHAQKRLWVLNQLEPGNVAYNMPGAFVFEGDLNREALAQTLHALISRHEMLRTTFVVVGGEPRQKIHAVEEYGFELRYEDLRHAADKESRSQAISYEESTQAFDLENGPLLRARLLQVENDRYIFLFTMHHIISDAWSMRVLIREVFILYKCYSESLTIPLNPLRIQYKDYAAWQNEQLSGEKLLAAQTYWWDQFKEEVPKLALPTDYARPSVKTYNGNQQEIMLSQDVTASLNELGQHHGGTLFMTLVSVMNVLLYHYTGQDDIIIGSPIVGRDHQDLEDQIGIYLNNLSLRSRFAGSDSFLDLLHSVKANTLEAYKYQHYPFDRLVDDLKLDRDMSRSPLFDVVVVLQNVEVNNEVREDDALKGRTLDSGFRASLVDLRIIFNEVQGRLNMTIEYNTDLFKPERIERMLNHFETLVTNIVKTPHRKLYELGYLTDVEQEQLINGFNLTQRLQASSYLLHQLTEIETMRDGSRVAVTFGSQSLTYDALNSKANQLAHYLRSQHQIGRDSRVGVMVDRSERLIIGLLAILKAGGCYVPIDPVYPNERKSYLFKDSEISLLLTESDKLFDLEGYSGSLFALDVELDGLTTPTTNPDYVNDENDLAYMIYTSGSTGHPKGVMIEHRGVVNMVLSQIDLFGVTREDKVLQFASSSFDASISEIFMALGCGGCVVMIGEGDQKDPLRFKDYVLSKGVSVATLPPSYVRVLPEESLSGLRVLITAGEPANVDDAIALSKDLDYFNAYGPTEYSVCVSVHKVRGDEAPYGSIPIGKPIPNTECYVLSESGSLTGIGIDGTLYVSGSGLARGYHNRKDLTDERFVSHPYKPGERLYNTGDIVRWTESGELLYKGRADKQLKLRGYRIETGEIESVLKQYEGVQEAVVEAIADGSGEKVLVGYIVAEDESLTAQEVKEHLQKYLPVYMVPGYIVTLTEIPLTASGKIDRQTLPKPGDMLDSTRQYVAPVTETEQSLVAIWEEVLGRKPIGIEDNFFEIGGQSLKAIQIVSRIQKEFNKVIALREIFNYPTIRALSEIIESDVVQRGQLITFSDTGDDLPNIFFIPPIIGSATIYKELADHLNDNFNTYGLQYSSLVSDGELDNSIEEIAGKLVDEILETSNSETIYLFGYSMGATVAFEMAKQLEAQGKSVSLILVDRGINDKDMSSATQIELDMLFELHVSSWRKYIGADEMERVKKMFINNMNSLKDYEITGLIKGNITTVSARDNHKGPNMEKWASHTLGKTSHLTVKGTHFDILSTENVADMSKALKMLLNEKNEIITIE